MLISLGDNCFYPAAQACSRTTGQERNTTIYRMVSSLDFSFVTVTSHGCLSVLNHPQLDCFYSSCFRLKQIKHIKVKQYWPWWRHQMETFSALLAICLMFSLICVWINGWINNRKAGDLRRHRVHYDVIVMPLWCVKGIFLYRRFLSKRATDTNRLPYHNVPMC